MSADGGDDNSGAKQAVYAQVGDNYRAMDDLRLRLLALLPLATGTGILVLLGGHGVSAAIGVPTGLFGMVVTVSLYFYELHGVEKCAHFIDRGAELEEDLKVPGSFTDRPHQIFGVVSELLPGALIYPASLTGWLFLALYNVDNMIRNWVTIVFFIFSVTFSVMAISVMERTRPRRRRRPLKPRMQQEIRAYICSERYSDSEIRDRCGCSRADIGRIRSSIEAYTGETIVYEGSASSPSASQLPRSRASRYRARDRPSQRARRSL